MDLGMFLDKKKERAFSHSRSLWGQNEKAPTANVPYSNDTSRTIGRSSNYLSSSEQQEMATDMSGELVVHAICKKLNAGSTTLCGELISDVEMARNLGVFFDKEMTQMGHT